MPPDNKLPEHFHTTDRIDYRDLVNKRGYLIHTILGDAAVTAQNWNTFFISPLICSIIRVQEVHQSAFSSGTLQIEKLTGTQNIGAGVNILNATLDLTAAANTVNTPTLTTTFPDLQLAAGNRLAMKSGGTLVGGSNVTVVIEIKLL